MALTSSLVLLGERTISEAVRRMILALRTMSLRGRLKLEEGTKNDSHARHAYVMILKDFFDEKISHF
jgi:hypothetical protein